MASIDGMPLICPEGEKWSGAAFALTVASPISSRISFDGVNAEVAKDSHFVVARGIRGDGFIPIVRAGISVALRALDIFSVKGVADLTLAETADKHITWKAGVSAPRVALYSAAIINATVSASAVVTDAEGNVRSDPPEIFNWHASMRFYRQAQNVDNLSEAMRNLWLAVENLLDELAPWQSGESEGAWLRRSLTVATNHLDLQQYLPAGSQPSIASASDYFYDELRTHLFHAKGTREPLLPDEVDGTNYLAARHERLTRLYLDLLNESRGVRRGKGGGLTYAGFDLATEGLQAGSSLAITDDPSPLRSEDSIINPAGGSVTSSPAGFAPMLSRPGRSVFSARMDHEKAARLEAVRRFGLIHADKELVASSSIEGRLELSGIEGLRGYYALRLNNTENPRYFPAY